MLSQTSEHAIRALIFLARQPAEASVSADRVAEALGAPRNYLSKTLNALARLGIVASTRGPNGGFRLAVSPESLTLADVVVFEPARPNRVCLLTSGICSDSTPCAAHATWSSVCRGMWEPLHQTTLADLLRSESIGAGPHAGNLRPAAVAV